MQQFTSSWKQEWMTYTKWQGRGDNWQTDTSSTTDDAYKCTF